MTPTDRVAGLLLATLLSCVQAVYGDGHARKQHGLLWEISEPGMQPGYLFGTIHSEDPAVLRLDGAVQRALDEASRVVLEVEMDREAMIYTSSAMLMTDGRLLSTILGEELFAQAASAMQTRGIPELVLERMKPWAVAMTLAMPPTVTGEFLDLTLYRFAREHNKPVYGLETIREQLDVFEGLPLDDQIALLRDAVEQFPGIDVLHADLLAAYRRRDLAALETLNEASMKTGDQRLARDFQQRLILDRNRRMAERIQEHLEAGGAFIAVGALHLPGEAGLLELLEQQGYSVRVVY
jgi:uncharacterized protein YbaP (TraB family)